MVKGGGGGKGGRGVLLPGALAWPWPRTAAGPEGTKVFQQSLLQLALCYLGAERKEVEAIGVFDEFLREVGLRCRKSAPEVG